MRKILTAAAAAAAVVISGAGVAQATAQSRAPIKALCAPSSGGLCVTARSGAAGAKYSLKALAHPQSARQVIRFNQAHDPAMPHQTHVNPADHWPFTGKGNQKFNQQFIAKHVYCMQIDGHLIGLSGSTAVARKPACGKGGTLWVVPGSLGSGTRVISVTATDKAHAVRMLQIQVPVVTGSRTALWKRP